MLLCLSRECLELKSKTSKLSDLLRQAARSSSDLYERPTRRIIDDTNQVLEKALTVAQKCRANGLLKRAFTIIPAAAFRKMFGQLENSIGDVSWLLRVSGGAGDDDGARDNDRYGKLIIEEGGVVPLLKLLKEGKTLEGQENAARALGLLGRDPESVEAMVLSGVCLVFAKILKEGPMKHNAVRLLVGHLAFETIQEHSKYVVLTTKSITGAASIHNAAVAMAAAANANQSNVVKVKVPEDEEKTQIAHPMARSASPSRLHNLVATATAQAKAKTNPPVAVAAPQLNGSSNMNANGNGSNSNHHNHNHSFAGGKIREREMEDPAVKANLKAMAAKALWHLAQGNSAICKSICESAGIALFCCSIREGNA
uniref:DUF7792 domain-containing protein n=1 Tax=Chenopodium quinoa TaxID=63459 RepID=A0A803NDL8_CHEQI